MTILDNIVSDKQDVKNQLGGTPSIIPIPKRFVEDITPVNVSTKIIKNTLDGTTLVWNNANQGDWGDDWGSSAVSSADLYAVIPTNDIHVEYFGQDMFIDTVTSTGTLDTSAETYALDAAEILQSEIIAKPQGPITTAKILNHDEILVVASGGMTLPFTLGTDTFGDTNITLQLSNDGGLTWETVSEGVTHTFATTTSDDELKYKITASEAITLTKPLFIQVNL